MIIVLSLILIGSLCSCESRIDLGDDGEGMVLMMNAQICTSDSTHYVMLARSRVEGVFPVNNAILSCFVNGSLVGESTIVDRIQEIPVSIDYDAGQGVSIMHFNAIFKPADKVCLKASSEGMNCEVQLTVPSIPKIMKAEAAKCSSEAESEYWTYRFDVNIKDINNEINFYRFKLLDRSYVQVVKSNENSYYHSGDILVRNDSEVPVDNTKEPLLNSGERTISSYFEQGNSYFDNVLNLFTDSAFRDDSYSMTVYTDKPFSLKPKTMEMGEVMQANNIATIQLMNIGREGYLYLTGYQFNNSIESGTYLTNDYIFPSNVVGGTGFVAIFTSVEYDIPLSSIRYDDSYYH